MNIAIFAVGFSIVLLGISVLIKGAGFIVGRSQISWKHSFVFAAILALLSIIFGVTKNFISIKIPLIFSIFIVISVEAMLASAYFHNRAKTINGDVIGHRKAALIGGTIFVLGMGGAVILSIIKEVLHLA